MLVSVYTVVNDVKHPCRSIIFLSSSSGSSPGTTEYERVTSLIPRIWSWKNPVSLRPSGAEELCRVPWDPPEESEVWGNEDYSMLKRPKNVLPNRRRCGIKPPRWRRRFDDQQNLLKTVNSKLSICKRLWEWKILRIPHHLHRCRLTPRSVKRPGLKVF